MGDYIEAQQKANEFNAQAGRDDLAALRRAVCVCLQALAKVYERMYVLKPGTVSHEYYQHMIDLLVQLTPPPGGEGV